jgi:hypothetical protein
MTHYLKTLHHHKNYSISISIFWTRSYGKNLRGSQSCGTALYGTNYDGTLSQHFKKTLSVVVKSKWAWTQLHNLYTARWDGKKLVGISFCCCTLVVTCRKLWSPNFHFHFETSQKKIRTSWFLQPNLVLRYNSKQLLLTMSQNKESFIFPTLEIFYQKFSCLTKGGNAYSNLL